MIILCKNIYFKNICVLINNSSRFNILSPAVFASIHQIPYWFKHILFQKKSNWVREKPHFNPLATYNYNNWRYSETYRHTGQYKVRHITHGLEHNAINLHSRESSGGEYKGVDCSDNGHICLIWQCQVSA